MSYTKRLISLACVVVFAVITLTVGMREFTSLTKKDEIRLSKKTTINLWYEDESLTDYINSAALNFYEATDVRVNPVLVSSTDFIKDLNDASVRGKASAIPDLYIIGNDSLSKAYLAGLTEEVKDEERILNSFNFTKAALDSVTFEGKYVAYPMYFETTVLLMNRTYLYNYVYKLIMKEKIIAESGVSDEDVDIENMTEEELEAWLEQEAMSQGFVDIPDFDPNGEYEPELLAQLQERYESVIPKSIEEIKAFADVYDAPENVEAVLSWDVTDIFYNYFFVGNYASLGGDTGDDSSIVDLYNEQAIECLSEYQSLNEFFSIDAATVDYETVLKDFIEGKTVYTLVTSDAIEKLEQARADGSFLYDYEVAAVPDVSEKLKSRAFSTTYCVCVNGYSEHDAAANELATYLTYYDSGSLYGRTGKIPSHMDAEYKYDAIKTFVDVYATSVPMPKLLATTNYWVEMELCFTKAWLGADVNLLLKALSEEMKLQITGAPVEETYIVMPEKEKEADEEYDYEE